MVPRIVLPALLAVLTLPPTLSAQGWIEPHEPVAGPAGVEKIRSDVRVRVDGRIAHLEVTEWFRNRGGRIAEGHYLYPLPADAAFRGFSLFQGEEELRGEVMDAAEARRIYEEIVRRVKDPALIELAGHGLLRARVFPIQPGETRKVTLRYTQLLARAGDALLFRYAGGVAATSRLPGPRWDREPPPRPHPMPPVRPLPVDREPVSGAEDGPRSPAPWSAGELELVVEDGDRFLDPFSPTHELEHRREGRRLTVRTRGPLAGSLSLFLPLARDGVGVTVATHRVAGEDGYFMLTLSPGSADGTAQPRDVTVVVDVSGSMSGEKIRQARAALVGLLDSLDPRDRFRLVAFSNSVRPWRLEWATAAGAHVAEARQWVESLVAEGGTNISGALEEAFRLPTPDGRLPVVIFVTDGQPTVGETSVERITARAEERGRLARIFAFGVGHDVNTQLLDRMTEAGRGATDYVQPGENVERALSLLAARIRHPVLTDLALARTPVRLVEVYPTPIPDVFAGGELVLFGRYEAGRRDAEGEVVLRGRRGGGERSFGVAAVFPVHEAGNDYIPRLWASRKLGFLTRRTWTEGTHPELVEEIRATALRYGLPSEYTSYLVLEPGVLAVGAARDEALLRASASPAPTAGARAVEAAAAAERMRRTRSVADLDAAESRLAESHLDVVRARAGETRAVAGRLFVLGEGVWTDTESRPGREVLAVAAFSRAWFDLLEALPELRPYLKALDPVVVAGAALEIRVGEGGTETLSPRRIAEAVRKFRNAEGARP